MRSFLQSRHIELSEGSPGDPPSAETVDGLGNRKNALVQELIHRDGVAPYEGSVAYVQAVRQAGLRRAVVSSSANCREVLESAGMLNLFEEIVDGVVAEREQLAGKPAPDTFLAAARKLDVEASEAAVFEDALAGVEAGRAGHFGIVVGVNRVGQREALLAHGADIVVDDLAELLDVIHHGSFPVEPWAVRETELRLRRARPARVGVRAGQRARRVARQPRRGGAVRPPRELPVGLLRGPAAALRRGAYGYPEAGQTIVNVTNGKLIRLLVEDEPFDVRYGVLERHERVLDLRAGVLRRICEWSSPAHTRVRITSTRLVSFTQRAVAAISYQVEPLDGPTPVVVQSELVANEELPVSEDDPRAAAAARHSAAARCRITASTTARC